MIVDIYKLLPPEHPQNKTRIEVERNSKTVNIFWINKGKKGNILSKQNQPKPFGVSRYIEIDERLGEVLGLYFGDGTKDDTSCVELANSCPELVILWTKHISEFGIEIKKLNFKIKLSENARLKYNVAEEDIEKYWRGVVNIPEDKEIKLMWVKTKGKPSTYIRKYGSLVVTYHNATFSLFYNTLIRNIRKFLNQKEFRIGFMRGLVAAEGNINIRKNGSLSLVRIAGNEKARKFFKRLLFKYFKIRSAEDKSNQLYIGSYRYLKFFHDFNLCTLHPEKSQSFENGYKVLLNNLNRKHDDNSLLGNRNASRILEMISEKPLKTQDIIRELNISREGVRNILNGYKSRGKYKYNGLKNLSLVSCRKNEDRKCQKIWKITKRGKMFLENSIKGYNRVYPNLELKNLP